MLSKEDIEKLADLARLKVSEDEKESLRADLDAIVGYVSEVNKLEKGKSVPGAGALTNVNLREDGEAHEAGMYTKDILGEAPHREGEYVKVKKIIGE